MHLYRHIVDEWILVDNSQSDFETIAKGTLREEKIGSSSKWQTIKGQIS